MHEQADSSGGRGGVGHRKTLGAILVAAFVLNVWGISFGLPAPGRAWDQDEIRPDAVLATMRHGLTFGRWPLKYPPVHYWVLRPAFGAALLVQDRLDRSGILTLTPEQSLLMLWYVSRGVSVAMGTLALLFLYLAAREALSRRGALFATAIAALDAPAVYYAKAANLDIPYVFWFSLSLWLFFRLLKRHRLLDYVGFVAAAVCAIGTKDPAYALYTFTPIPVLYTLALHDRRTGRPRRSIPALLVDYRVLLGCVTAGVVFVLGHHILVDPSHFIQHVRMLGPYSGEFSFFENTFDGQIQNLRLSFVNTRFSLGWPLLLWCVAGVGAFLLRERREPAFPVLLAGLLMAVSYQVTFIAVIRFSFERYFIPVCMILALFGGKLMDRAWSASRLRPLARTAVTVALLWGALRVATMDLMMVHDSRYRVEAWLREREPTGMVALGVGDPARLPRMARRAWGSFLRDRWLLEREGIDTLVINRDDLPPDAGARSYYSGLLGGGRSFEPVLRYRWPPPLDVFDASGSTGSLAFINSELVVFQRILDRRIAHAARRAGFAVHPLVETAITLRQLGLGEEAMRRDAQALQDNPHDPLAIRGRARDLEESGCAALAEDWLRAALPGAGSGDEVWLDLARLLARQDRGAEALDLIRPSVLVAGEDPWLWREVAEIARIAGHRARAAGSVRRAETLARGDGWLYLELARELRDLGMPARAVALAGEAARRLDDEPQRRALERFLKSVGEPRLAAWAAAGLADAELTK